MKTENNLSKAFEYIRKFYREIAQMLSDLNELMAKDGWGPAGSNIYADTSRAIDNPDDWIPRYLYKNYIKKETNHFIKGVLIFFARDDFPQSIVFGNAFVPVKSDYQWAIWDLWYGNKEKLKKLTSETIEIQTNYKGETISGKLKAIPLTAIQSKEDIKNIIVQKLLEME